MKKMVYHLILKLIIPRGDKLKSLDIKVEYVYHSGFTVKTKNNFLVFDYYKGKIDLDNIKTYVFASHGHGDHFNPNILNWKRDKEDISYIFSSDITLDNKDSDIYSLDPYKILYLNDIAIETYGSTDLGVSFLINIDGISMFYAGDLNWWHWDDDSDEEKLSMEKAFKEEIQKIKGKKVDIAFFPVDPRLGEYYYLGGEHLINEVKPNYFIPMHFGDNFYITKEFIHKVNSSYTHVVEINKENQLIKL